MLLSYPNPKPCVSVNTVVVNLYRITEPRKEQLKVEILHNLKERF